MVIEALKKWAQTDRTAAIAPDGQKLSFSELDKRSDAIAAVFKRQLGLGTPVIIRGDKENDVLSCMFASIKSGNPYTFVPGYFPEKKFRNILAASGAEMVISLCGKPEYELDATVLDQQDIDRICEDGTVFDCAYPSKDDIAMIFFTSGSTGNPKGVMISHGNLEAFAEWWGKTVDRGIDRVRVLNFSSYTFSASLATIFDFMLYLGGTLYAVDRTTSQNFPKLMELIYDVKPNYLDCTPSFLDLCMQNEKFGTDTLPSMKFISVGGEPLTTKIAKTALERFHGADIINGYGTTETTIGTIFCKVTSEMLNTDGPLPIGYTKEGSYILVVDENHVPVPDGTPGELVIASALVSQGYINEPKKTAKAFYTDENGKRAFYTGDIVRKEADGLVYYIGRSNNMLKIGGYRVELEEIELVLNAVEGVQQGVTVPVFDGNRAVMLAAFVKCENGAPQGLTMISKIKKAMREILPPYMVPQKILFVDEFLKNNNDKLDRAAMTEQVRLK